MKKFSILFLLVMCLALTSCMENAYTHMLLRSPEDPFDDTPVVDQCSQYLKMNVSWKEDPCTDYYVLMRHDDDYDDKNEYDEVYRGTGLFYTEVLTETSHDKRYIYRLDKYRGNTGYFKGSSYGYGFNNMSTTNEPNDSPEQAVFLEDPVDEQITVVRYSDGTPYQDYDYFYVRVPSKKTACVIVRQENDGLSTGDPIELCCYDVTHGKDVKKVTQGDEIPIKNTSTQAAYFYFYITATNEVTEDVGSGNFRKIDYTISVAKWYEGTLE